MHWDASRKKWIFEWEVTNRRLNILDVDRAVVWAVSRKGPIGPAFTIPLRYLFAEPSHEQIKRQLESPWPNVREEARELLNARDK